jgi:hypothetical protein
MSKMPRAERRAISTVKRAKYMLKKMSEDNSKTWGMLGLPDICEAERYLKTLKHPSMGAQAALRKCPEISAKIILLRSLSIPPPILRPLRTPLYDSEIADPKNTSEVSVMGFQKPVRRKKQ